MKIRVEWKRESEGTSEIEVPEDKVLAWINDPVYGNKEPVTEVTPQLAFDWLQSGDDDVWIDQIDVEADERLLPWNDIELERLAKDRKWASNDTLTKSDSD